MRHANFHLSEVQRCAVVGVPEAGRLAADLRGGAAAAGTRWRARTVEKYAAGLCSIKKIAQYIDVIYADERFTRENGMLRPNMKPDRKAIVAKYR